MKRRASTTPRKPRKKSITKKEEQARAEAEQKRKAEQEVQAAEAKRQKLDAAAKGVAQEAARDALAEGVRGDAAKPGELVSSVPAPKCELRLIEGGRVLALLSLENANRKVPKHTLLGKWSERCTLSSKVAEGTAWAIQPKDVVLVKESNTCMQLAKAFKEHYQKIGQIFGYKEFPAGSLPKTLTATPGVKPYRLDFSDESFKDTRKVILQALEVARSAAGAQFVWVVKGDDSKNWVRPCGIAIVSTGQLALQASRTHRFTA
jgi:hypothetical protein